MKITASASMFSSRSKVNKSSVKQLISIFLIALISAALVIFLFQIYYLTADRYGSEAAIVFQNNDLTLVAGKGNVKKDGLEIRQVSTQQGVAFASSSLINIPAQRYSTLEWYIGGLREETDIRFVWATRSAPRTKREVRLTHSGSEFGHVNLAEESYWQGTIAGIGLMVYGELSEPLVVRKLELKQPPPEISALLAQLWSEWLGFEGWSQRSINFIVGGSHDTLLSPVLAVAAWVGLSSLSYAGLMLIRRKPWSWRPWVIFFLVGWLVLDIRWQWNLWQQLQITHEKFAGKSQDEKLLAGEVGALYQFVRDVKANLPDEPVRIFLLTEDRYIQGRVHYYLLPYNVNSGLSHPTTQARPGDYLLLIRPIRAMNFDRKEQLLHWEEKHSLPVETVYSSSPGILFRVKSD